MSTISVTPCDQTTTPLKDQQMYDGQTDSVSTDPVTEYNLPLVNRDLILPDLMVWQNLAMAQMYAMYDQMPYYYDNCMAYGFDNLPSLNHMATSYNTEEANSQQSAKKSRKSSYSFDFENSESSKKNKGKSDIRLKTQEKRLQNHGLKYESKETYNPKTKRTSRVLVCLHDGCGKEFKKTRNLIIHSRVHTKIRPHVCQFCNKGFTQQCNLKKHIELHMNGTFKGEQVVA